MIVRDELLNFNRIYVLYVVSFGMFVHESFIDTPAFFVMFYFLGGRFYC